VKLTLLTAITPPKDLLRFSTSRSGIVLCVTPHPFPFPPEGGG
jgi:hypothetical protein